MGFMKLMIFYVVKYVLIFIFSIYYIGLFLSKAWKRRNNPSSYKERNEEPSCLLNPALGKHDTVTLQKYHDFKIHYVANGSRNKPLMLFLHGFPEFWYIWKYQLPVFGQDYYAVAIDLPGYGKSSKPVDLSMYTASELATCVKEFIKELGYESCVLVGHDWGGSISYRVAMDFPEVVDKLIVMNCPHASAFAKVIRNGKQLLLSGYMFFFQLPYLPEYILSAGDFAALELMREGAGACKNLDNFPEEDMEAYKYTFQKGGYTGPLNFYRNTFSMPTNSARPKRIQLEMPFLLIWGTGDTALGVELAHESLKYMNNGQVKYVDGASHWVNIDEPKIVNKYMKEFLAE